MIHTIFLEYIGSQYNEPYRASFGDEASFGSTATEAIGRLVLKIGPESLNLITCCKDKESFQQIEKLIPWAR